MTVGLLQNIWNPNQNNLHAFVRRRAPQSDFLLVVYFKTWC